MVLDLATEPLKIIFMLANDMLECTEICTMVHERLVFIHEKLSTMEKKGTLPREILIVRYRSLVLKYKAFLEKHTRRPWVYRLVASKHIIKKVGGFQDSITTLMMALSMCDMEAAADERVKMQAFREQQERLIMNQLTDDATIVAEVSDEGEQVEALSVLVHELKSAEDERSLAATSSSSSSDDSTTATTADRQVLATALNKVMRQSRVSVGAIPDWFLAPHNVEYEKRAFAGGSFGLVHRGRMNFMDVVVKCLRVDMRNNARIMKQFREEATLWFSFRHRHVLMMYGACDVSSPPFIVCEYAARGNLADYVSKECNRGATVQLLREAASGLAYLHAHRVVHADLKCDNILVASDGTAKVADFSFSYVRTLQSKAMTGAGMGGGRGSGSHNMNEVEDAKKEAGAMRWRAPECLMGRSPTSASDVYSFGMCILEAVTHYVPWGFSVDDDTVRFLVTSGKLPEKPARMSDHLWDLVERMCSFDPEDRPTLEDVMSELGVMSAADVGVVETESVSNSISIGHVTRGSAAPRIGASINSDTIKPSAPKRDSTPITPSEFQRLIAACQTGDLNAVRSIMDTHANALREHSPDNKNDHPLLLASRNGHLEIVKLLVNHAADLETTDSSGWTSLQLASYYGHIEVVSALIKSNANVGVKNNSGATALYIACEKGHAKVVSELIRHNANLEAAEGAGWTPLIIAAFYGHLAAMSELINNGVNMEGRNSNQATALYIAAEKGHVEVVSELIRRNANIEARDINGWTPLIIAAYNGHLSVMSELIKCKANVEAKNDKGVTALYIAAENGRIDVVIELRKHGANANMSDIGGWTPLMIAAFNGHHAVIGELINSGANMEGRNSNQATALYIAAEKGHVEAVSELIRRNANIEARDINGWTPLIIAAYYGHLSVVSELIKCKANVEATNNNGMTALHIAAENGRIDVVIELRKHGASPIAMDMSARTPIALAVQNGHNAVVAELTK